MDVAVGEQRQRRACLLVRAPEQRREDEQHEDGRDPAPVVDGERTPPALPPSRGRIGCPACRLLRGDSLDRGLQVATTEDVLRETEEHPEPGTCEAKVPIDALGDPARDDGAEEGAEVDSHVEHGKAGVAPFIAGFIESAHERADVWLQQSRADHDQAEAGIEKRETMERQREVAERDDDPTEQHAAVLPEPGVGDQSAEDRREPHAGDVGGVGIAGLRVGKGERFRHVQDEEPAHPVIAEALPHLGEEERGETARVAEELLFAVHRSNRSSCSAESGCSAGLSSVPSRPSHFSTSK